MDNSSTTFFNSFIKFCHDIKNGASIPEANSFFMKVSENIGADGVAAFLLTALSALNDAAIEYDDFVAIICAKYVQDCCLQSSLISIEELGQLESVVLDVMTKRHQTGIVPRAFQSQYEKSIAAIMVAYMKFDSFPSVATSKALRCEVIAPCRFSVLQQVAEILLDKSSISGSATVDCVNLPRNKYNLGDSYSSILAECCRICLKVSDVSSSIISAVESSSEPSQVSSSGGGGRSTMSIASILGPLKSEIETFAQCISCLSCWNEALGSFFSSNCWTLQIILEHTISNSLCPISENLVIQLIDTSEKLKTVSRAICGCGVIPGMQSLLTSLHELLISYVLQSTDGLDTSLSNIEHNVLEAVIQSTVLPKNIVSELKHVVTGAYTMRYFHSLIECSETIAGGSISDWQLATLQHFSTTHDTESVINSTMSGASFLIVNDQDERDNGDDLDVSLIVTVAENLSTIVDKFMFFISEPNKLKDFIALFIQSKFGSSFASSLQPSLSPIISSTSLFWSRIGTCQATSQSSLAIGALSLLYCIPHSHVSESLVEVIAIFPKLGAESSAFISTLGPTVGVFLTHVSMNHCRIPSSVNPDSVLVYERRLRSLWNNSAVVSRSNSTSDPIPSEDEDALDTKVQFRQEIPALINSLCKEWNFYDGIVENMYVRTMSHLDQMGVAMQGASSSDVQGGIVAVDRSMWQAMMQELELLLYMCYILVDVAGETASPDCVARRRWDEFMAALTVKFKALSSYLIEAKLCDSMFLVVAKRFLELWIRYMDILTVSAESISETIATVGAASFSRSEIASNLIQFSCSIFELNSIDLITISSHVIWSLWYNHPSLVYNFAEPLSHWYSRVLFSQLSVTDTSSTLQSTLAFSTIDDSQFQERLFYSFGKSIMFLTSEEEFASLFKKSFEVIFLSLDTCTKSNDVLVSEQLRLCKISLYQLKGLIKGVYSPKSLCSDGDDDDDCNFGNVSSNPMITLETASEYLRTNFYMIISGLMSLSIWLQKEIYGPKEASSSSSIATAIGDSEIELADQMLGIVASTLENVCDSLQLQEGLVVEIITKLREICASLGANSHSLSTFIASMIRNSIQPAFTSARALAFDLTASMLQFSQSLITEERIVIGGGDAAEAVKVRNFVEGAVKVYLPLIFDIMSSAAAEAEEEEDGGGGGGESKRGGYFIDGRNIELTALFLDVINAYTRTLYRHDLPVDASMSRISTAAIRGTADFYSKSIGVDVGQIGRTIDSSLVLFETCFTALYSSDVAIRNRKFNYQLLEAVSKLLFNFTSSGLHELVIPRLESIIQSVLQAINTTPSLSSSSALKTFLIDPSALCGELTTAIGAVEFNAFKAILNETFKLLNSKT